MRYIFVVFLFFSLLSCSSQNNRKKVALVVENEKVSTIHDIRASSNQFLNKHTELDVETKNNLRSIIYNAIDKHVSLKTEESKIINYLLINALKTDSEFKNQVDHTKYMKKRLKEIYKEKSVNVTDLIDKIHLEMNKKHPADDFAGDMINIVRELR